MKKHLTNHSLLKKLKLVSSKLLFVDHAQLRQLSPNFALIFIFFDLFLFFLMNFLTNFISTQAVIVNTDEIIDSNEKLLITKKVLFIHDSDLDFLLVSKKISILSKLAKRVKKNNQYFTEPKKALELVKKGEASSFFIYNFKQNVLSYLLEFAQFIKNPIIFMKPTNYYEIINSYSIKKKLEKNKKKFIHQW